MKKPDVISVHGLDVEYRAWPAHRGHRDKYGAQEEPDESSGFEIQGVNYKGICIDNVIEELGAWDIIEAWVEEALIEMEEEQDCSYIDAMYERLKDERMGL